MNRTASTHVDPALPPLGPFPPARRSQSWMVLLPAAVLFAVAVRVFGPAWARTIFSEASIAGPADVGALGLAFVASVLLHELGHLVAALALGFHIMAVNFGPVRWVRTGDNWSCHLRRHGWWMASVVAVPAMEYRGDQQRWRRDMLLVIAAGPAATFLAIIVPVYLLLPGGAHLSGRTTVAFLAELNAILFVLGLFPNGKGAGVRNDASLIAALLSDGPGAREILLYQMLVQLTLQGLRPCDYPERLIREMALWRTRADFAAVFAEAICHWAWDRGDFETAESWLNRAAYAAAACDPRMQSRVLSQYACFSLIVHKDRTKARCHLTSVCLDMLSPIWLRHRTAAVAALSEWKSSQAETELGRALAMCQKDVPYFEFERKLIQSLWALSNVA